MTYNEINPNIIGIITAYKDKIKYLKYCQLEEFYYLSISDMDRITKKISGQAEIRYLNDETNGLYIDYDGTVYKYNITSNDTYGITKIEKYNERYEEYYDGRINSKNNENVTTGS